MRLNDILFPSNIKCIFCRREIESDIGICPECNGKLPYITGNKCAKCGGEVTGEEYCIDCSRDERVFVRNYAVFRYTGDIRDKVSAFKSGKAYLSTPFAHILYDYYTKLDIDFDIVIPMPIHKNRERERGFNQAKLLTVEIAKHTGIVRDDIIIKAIDTTHQTGLSRQHRLTNLRGSFEVVDKSAVKDKVILVVDDIYTTGSTMNEVADTIMRAGAGAVYGLCLARGRTIEF